VRYEAGETAQSDLLRAQLERMRLRQRRWTLESEERRRLAVLNRLRGHALDEPMTTRRTLADLPDPVLPDIEQEAQASESASPELKKARLSGTEADRRVDLASKERWPDVTVSAGVMPRWGNFDTMWQAGVSFNIPIWSVGKQLRAIAENRARGQAVRSGGEALREILRQRVYERMQVLRSLVDASRLYRGGLLVQSEATASSTMLQYQVGRLAFASVLEALAGYLADQNSFLESIVAAQRIAIAEREISLDVPGGSAGSDLGTAGAASSSEAAAESTGGASSPM